jgi:hypothetical protein
MHSWLADKWKIPLWFVVANLALFAAYRMVFLANFAAGSPSTENLRILLYGLRLDLALLGIELFLVVLPALVVGRWHPRRRRLALWVITWLHGMICAANIQFFAERNQHVWELLIANLTRPDQIYLAIEPFIDEHRVLGAAVLIGSVLFLALAVRASRGATQTVQVFQGRERRRAFKWAVVLLLLTNLDPLAIKKNDWPLGWVLIPTASQYYMRFDDYLLNQTVINPIHDLVRYYLPANLAGLMRYGNQGLHAGELDPDQALQRTLEIQGITPTNIEYPLFREVSTQNDLGIRNVIMVEVEGLSDSLLHHDFEGRAVMPFLRRLSQESLYFNKIYQSADATDGSVFSITTSLPKTFSEIKTEFFVAYEVNGHFGSLPTILRSKNYSHYFLQAFRHRAGDFVSFMGNQGYRTYDFSDFEARLDGSNDPLPSSSALGVFDGAFLSESAEILASAKSPFTAQLLTSTSHSPWAVPEGFPTPFGKRKLDTFHYVDSSLEAFFAKLRRTLPDFDKTLIVITGDHTSVTFGSDYFERIHVPLIFYSPALQQYRADWQERLDTPGSHVDIIPTILDLLGGRHNYAGMGKSLLRDEARNRGILSGNRYSGLYIRDGFVFVYEPYSPETERSRLYRVKEGQMKRRNVSKKHPEVLQRMRMEYLAQYETSRRLTREKRIFPVNVTAQTLGGM